VVPLVSFLFQAPLLEHSVLAVRGGVSGTIGFSS
jgi:hypothetical protein